MLALIACNRPRNQFQGYVEGYFSYMSSNSDGFLQLLNVYRGDPVKAGQVLFMLEKQPEASKYEQAVQSYQQASYNLADQEKGQRATVIAGIEAQIDQVLADMEFAKKTLVRNERLVKTNAIAKQDYDQALSTFNSDSAHYQQLMANLNEAKLGARTDVVKSSMAAVGAAAANVDQAQWYLRKKTITSPGNGSVLDTYYRMGEFVPAGHPVLALVLPKDVRVIFYIPEPILGQVAIGDTVKVSCDSCKTVSGRIVFISPRAEFTPPTIFSEKERRKFVFRLEAQFNDADAAKLHPGQPVDVFLTRKLN